MSPSSSHSSSSFDSSTSGHRFSVLSSVSTAATNSIERFVNHLCPATAWSSKLHQPQRQPDRMYHLMVQHGAGASTNSNTMAGIRLPLRAAACVSSGTGPHVQRANQHDICCLMHGTMTKMYPYMLLCFCCIIHVQWPIKGPQARLLGSSI